MAHTFAIGDLVEVARRMTPGMNKPGGTAKVIAISTNAQGQPSISVKYVVDRTEERDLGLEHVKHFEFLNSRGRSSVGRCLVCKSFRKDCGGCDQQQSVVELNEDFGDEMDRAPRRPRPKRKPDHTETRKRRLDQTNDWDDSDNYNDSLDSGSSDDELFIPPARRRLMNTSVLELLKDKPRPGRDIRLHKVNATRSGRIEPSNPSHPVGRIRTPKTRVDVQSTTTALADTSSPRLLPPEMPDSPEDFQNHTSRYEGRADLHYSDDDSREGASVQDDDDEVLDNEESPGKDAFIQPEGNACNLPDDVKDQTKDVDFVDLPDLFERIVSQLEQKELPAARDAFDDFLEDLHSTENDPVASGAQKDGVLKRASATYEKLLHSLVRQGTDQCQAALRKLSSKKLMRESRGKFSKKDLKSFQSKIDLWEIRCDDLIWQVEKLLKAFRDRLKDEEMDNDLFENTQDPRESDQDEGAWGENDDYFASDLHSVDSSIGPSNLEERPLAPFDHHQYASKRRDNPDSAIEMNKRYQSTSTRRRGKSKKSALALDVTATSNRVASLKPAKTKNKTGVRSKRKAATAAASSSKASVLESETFAPLEKSRRHDRSRHGRQDVLRDESLKEAVEGRSNLPPAENLDQVPFFQSHPIGSTSFPNTKPRSENERAVSRMARFAEKNNDLISRASNDDESIAGSETIINNEPEPAISVPKYGTNQKVQLFESLRQTGRRSDAVGGAIGRVFTQSDTTRSSVDVVDENELDLLIEALLPILQNDCKHTLQDLLSRELNSVGLTPRIPIDLGVYLGHLRRAILICNTLDRKQSHPAQGIFSRKWAKEFVDAVGQQVVEALWSLNTLQPWGLREDVSTNLQGHIESLLDALASRDNLMERMSFAILKELCTPSYWPSPGGDWIFISCFDPARWKAILTGLDSSSWAVKAEPTRYDEIRNINALHSKVMPRAEIDAIWSMIAIFGKEQNQLESQGHYLWTLLSGLLESGDAIKHSSELLPGPAQVCQCEEDVRTLCTLISAGFFDKVSPKNSVLKNVVLHSIKLGNRSGSNQIVAGIEMSNIHRLLAEDAYLGFLNRMLNIPKRNDARDYVGGLQESLMLPLSEVQNAGKLMMPASSITRQCVALVYAWISRLTKKRAQFTRIKNETKSLLEDLQAASISRETDESDPFENAFEIVSITPEETNQLFFVEAVSYIEIFSLFGLGKASHGTRFAEKIDALLLSQKLWGLLTTERLKEHLDFIQDQGKPRPAKFRSNMLRLHIVAKIFCSLLLLMSGVDPMTFAPLGDDSRVSQSDFASQHSAIVFMVNVLQTCLECACQDDSLGSFSFVTGCITFLIFHLRDRCPPGSEQSVHRIVLQRIAEVFPGVFRRTFQVFAQINKCGAEERNSFTLLLCLLHATDVCRDDNLKHNISILKYALSMASEDSRYDITHGSRGAMEITSTIPGRQIFFEHRLLLSTSMGKFVLASHDSEEGHQARIFFGNKMLSATKSCRPYFKEIYQYFVAEIIRGSESSEFDHLAEQMEPFSLVLLGASWDLQKLPSQSVAEEERGLERSKQKELIWLRRLRSGSLPRLSAKCERFWVACRNFHRMLQRQGNPDSPFRSDAWKGFDTDLGESLCRRIPKLGLSMEKEMFSRVRLLRGMIRKVSIQSNESMYFQKMATAILGSLAKKLVVVATSSIGLDGGDAARNKQLLNSYAIAQSAVLSYILLRASLDGSCSVAFRRKIQEHYLMDLLRKPESRLKMLENLSTRWFDNTTVCDDRDPTTLVNTVDATLPNFTFVSSMRCRELLLSFALDLSKNELSRLSLQALVHACEDDMIARKVAMALHLEDNPYSTICSSGFQSIIDEYLLLVEEKDLSDIGRFMREHHSTDFHNAVESFSYQLSASSTFQDEQLRAERAGVMACTKSKRQLLGGLQKYIVKNMIIPQLQKPRPSIRSRLVAEGRGRLALIQLLARIIAYDDWENDQLRWFDLNLVCRLLRALCFNISYILRDTNVDEKLLLANLKCVRNLFGVRARRFDRNASGWILGWVKRTEQHNQENSTSNDESHMCAAYLSHIAEFFQSFRNTLRDKSDISLYRSGLRESDEKSPFFFWYGIDQRNRSLEADLKLNHTESKSNPYSSASSVQKAAHLIEYCPSDEILQAAMEICAYR